MPEREEREIPLAEARRHAEGDPILAGMIRRKVPLSRNAYLTLAYGVPPDDWNAEHEMSLPEPFRRPLTASRRGKAE